MLNIVFRVDSSHIIGTGHVMRCIAIANAIRQKHGANICFFSRRAQGHINKVIAAGGFKLVEMLEPKPLIIGEVAHANWLGATQEDDAQEFTLLLKREKIFQIDCLIIDHYAIDIFWHKRIRGLVKTIFVIDDLGDRTLDCDFLLDQTYKCQSNKYDKLTPKNCKLMLGTDYALLRDEFKFSLTKVQDIRRKQSKTSILVMFGGTDPDNLTLRTLVIIARCENIDKITVVMGPTASHLDEIESFCNGKDNISLKISPSNIAELMLGSNLAIGASGTISWERCAMGLPAIVVIQAANQRMVANELERIGVISVLASDYTDIQLVTQINNWISNDEFYNKSVEECLKICDGRGTERVVNMIFEKTNFKIRNAQFADIQLFFEWVNASEVRKNAFSKKPIEFNNHAKWFKSKMNSEDCFMFVGIDDDNPIGQVRFELAPGSSEFLVDIHLSSKSAGRGYGTLLLKESLNRLSKVVADSFTVVAIVFVDNIASIKCFELNGFKLVKHELIENENCLKYEWLSGK